MPRYLNKTKIPYADYTLNWSTGCSPISAGCDHCWAAKMANRLKGRCGYCVFRPFGPVFHSERLKAASELKKPSTIALNFMGDMFHDDISTSQIGRMFGEIALTPRHRYLLLTKRPNRMYDAICWWRKVGGGALKNVWFGVSVEHQETAWRIDVLKAIPNINRWVSFEPLIGPVNHKCVEGLDWVVVGCEAVNGKPGRPMDPQAYGEIGTWCKGLKIPFFLKQFNDDRGGVSCPQAEHVLQIPWKEKADG